MLFRPIFCSETVSTFHFHTWESNRVLPSIPSSLRKWNSPTRDIMTQADAPALQQLQCAKPSGCVRLCAFSVQSARFLSTRQTSRQGRHRGRGTMMLCPFRLSPSVPIGTPQGEDLCQNEILVLRKFLRLTVTKFSRQSAVGTLYFFFLLFPRLKNPILKVVLGPK